MSQPPGVGASNPQIFWSATRFDQEPAKNGDASAPTLASLQTKVSTQTTTSQKTSLTNSTAALATDSLQQAESPYQTLNETASPLPPANAPVLTPSTGDIRLADQFNVQETLQNLAAKMPLPPMTPEKSFMVSVEKLSSLSAEGPIMDQMSELAGSMGTSLLDIQAQVNFAVTHPNAPVNPQIRAIAQQVYIQATGQVQQQYDLQGDWQPSSEELQKLTESTDGLMAATNIAKFMFSAGQAANQGIPREKLIFALDHPNLQGLDPTVLATSKKIENEAVTTTNQTFGAPDGWKLPEDGEELSFNDTRVSGTYIEEFEEQLQKLVKKGKISQGEATQIRTQFYNPDAEISLGETLSGISNELIGKAQAKIQDKYGTPEGYHPFVPKSNYDTLIRTTLVDQFKDFVSSGEFGLSSSEQEQFLSVLYGETSIDSIPSGKRAVFDEIEEKTLSSINAQFGVNYTQLPSIPMSIVAAVNNQQYITSRSALKLSQEFLKGKLSYPGVPESDPNRTLILDAMKVIGEALDNISRILSESVIASTEAAKRVSTGQMDIQLNKLDKQRIQIEEQIEQLEKQQSMAFMGPLMDALLLVFGVLTGGWALILAVAVVVINNTIGMDKFIEAIVNFLSETFGLPKFLAKLITVILLLLIASTAGFIVGIDIAFQIIMESKILQDFLALFGASEKAQQIFAMVVMILLMIAVIIIGFFMPPMMAEVVPAMVVTAVLNMVGRIIKLIISMVIKVLQVLMRLLQPLMKVLNAIAKAIVRMMRHLLEMMKAADDVAQMTDDAARMTAQTSQVGAKAAPTLTKAGTQASQFQKSLDKLINWLTKLQNSLDDVAESGDDAVKASQNTAKSADDAGDASKASKYMDSFKKGLKELGEGFKDDMQSAYKEAQKTLEQNAEMAGKSIDKTSKVAKSGDDAAKVSGGVAKGADATTDVTKVAGKADDAANVTADISKSSDTATTKVANQGDDLAEVGGRGSRVGGTISKAFSKYDPQQFIDFIKTKMRRLWEDIVKMKDDMVAFFNNSDNFKLSNTDLGKSIDDFDAMKSWKSFKSGVTDKLSKIKKSLTELGWDDVTDFFKDIGKSFDESTKYYKDALKEGAEVLKKDPSKIGDANMAFTRALSKDMGQAMFKMVEIITGIIQMVTSAIQFFNSLILADMAKRIAQLEAAMKQMDAVIAIMKTVINTLLKDVEVLSAHKQSVQELQAKKWTQLSQIMSKLASANSSSTKG